MSTSLSVEDFYEAGERRVRKYHNRVNKREINGKKKEYQTAW